EIDLKIEGLALEASSKDLADDPILVVTKAISKLGDEWQLGSHRILCGDARNLGAFETLMKGRHADLIFIDGPYNVAIDGHATGNGKVRHHEFPMAAGEMSE